MGFLSLEMGLLLFICVSSFGVYGVFLTGWVCDSQYSFLGAIRAVAQRISYEVFLSICLFCPIVLVRRFNMMELREFRFFSFLVGQELLVL